MIVINAYLAKGLTIQKRQDNFEANIKTVMNAIEAAIRKECTHCAISNGWYNFKYDDVLSYFKELGYLIEEKDTYIEISWDI